MKEVYVHYMTGKRFRFQDLKSPWIQLIDLSDPKKGNLWVHQAVFAQRYQIEKPK